MSIWIPIQCFPWSEFWVLPSLASWWDLVLHLPWFCSCVRLLHSCNMLFCLLSQNEWMSCCLLGLYFFPENIFCLVFGINQISIQEPSVVAVGTLFSMRKGGTKPPQSGKSVGCWRNPVLLHCFTWFSVYFVKKGFFILSSFLFLKVVSAVNHGHWCCQFYLLIVFYFSFCYILVCSGVF